MQNIAGIREKFQKCQRPENPFFRSVRIPIPPLMTGIGSITDVIRQNSTNAEESAEGCGSLMRRRPPSEKRSPYSEYDLGEYGQSFNAD